MFYLRNIWLWTTSLNYIMCTDVYFENEFVTII